MFENLVPIPGQVLVFVLTAGSSQAITLGEKDGVRTRAKFRPELTPGALLTFLPRYSLNNLLLEKSLIYWVFINFVLGKKL